LKGKFENLGKPEEVPVVKAKKISKASKWGDANVTSAASGKHIKTSEVSLIGAD